MPTGERGGDEGRRRYAQTNLGVPLGGARDVAIALPERVCARGLGRWGCWWCTPKEQTQTHVAHASWFENTPWTRLEGVSVPKERKPLIDIASLRDLDPIEVRNILGDGCCGGLYERPDEDVMRIWRVAVDEIRDVLINGWASDD